MKTASFCAYRERSLKEVKEKLFTLGLPDEKSEKLIKELAKEGFVDEERFARSYSRGKFRMKRWGKLKIIAGLKQHEISLDHIRTGLIEINNDEYLNTVKYLITNKLTDIKDKDTYTLKNKLARYLSSKGFESDIVWDSINKIIN